MEGIRLFRELYTGKRREDRNAWSDYFLSPAFLEGYREKELAQRMLETVEESRETYPPGQSFLTELCIAYGLRSRRDQEGLQVQMEEDAVFDGVEAIGAILKMGPAISRFKGNDAAMIAGFRDYRALLALAAGGWDDEAMLRLSGIVDGYLPHRISDTPVQNVRQGQTSQRHPKSLKLLVFFFSDERVPARVCRVPWNHLHLETATLGREKLWYGELREVVLRRLPRLEEQPKVSYMQLREDINRINFYANQGKDYRARMELDAFFDRADMRSALEDEVFVEEEVLRYWIGINTGEYLLEKLQKYYGAHRQAPFAGRILEEIRVAQCRQGIQRKFREDMEASLSRGNFDFHNRACLRYYLNVAFPLARGMKGSGVLKEFLDWYMPYSPAWGIRLADEREGGFGAGHPIEYTFGKNVLRIRLYPRHIDYRWNDSPLVPFYPGQNLAGIADDFMFWMLAPIARADVSAYSEIRQELTLRLIALLPVQEAVAVITDCIAGHICHSPEENLPMSTFYVEKMSERALRLFGCNVYGDGGLTLYELVGGQNVPLPNGVYSAPSVELAAQLGDRLLRELVSDQAQELYIELLPERIVLRNQWNSPSALAGEQVTEAVVRELFEKYFADKLNRLELVWGQRSLLFLKEGTQYVCFYFDHSGQSWYALVGMPELYRTAESDSVAYVPFGMGMLPCYLIHQNTNLLRSLLGEVLRQTACPKPRPKTGMWSPQIYRFDIRQRYRLAMRQFGGYPAEQARSQLADRFYIPGLPESMAYEDLEGRQSQKSAADRDKAAVQNTLAEYMAGRLARLVLTWQYQTQDGQEGTIPSRRSLCLVQDEGAHMMSYWDERQKGVDYLVSDVEEYMSVKGKKYRKAVFQGRTVPGYLVHTDLQRIRDSLDLLIPQMKQRMIHMGGFGEFSHVQEKL